MINKSGPLLFVHIPKTAGTTMHSILAAQYSKLFTTEGLGPKESIDRFKAFSQEKIKSFEVIKGHLTLQLLDYLENPILMTFLRDPIDCCISSYHYIQRATWNRNHDIIKNLSLEEYLIFAIENGLDNHQTRHLSNSIENNPSKESPKMKIEGASLLQQAKSNLDKFDFVFHTPQFDKALLILFKELKWKKKPFYTIKNKTENRPDYFDISPDVIEKIKELEKYDMELFEHSKTKNLALMNSFTFKEELELFQHENSIYQKTK